ncbi:MAG: hypothetical protein P8184_06390 [Calditrichia bacterium]
MVNLVKYSFLAVLFAGVAAQAQTTFRWNNDDLVVQRLELRQKAAAQAKTDDPSVQDFDEVHKLSVGKSVLFSLAVPGAGQFYSKSYVKSAIFLAVEAGAWATYFAYMKKGDNKDAEFKQYADQRWSEYRYWSYVNYKAATEMENPPELYPYDEVDAPNGGRWYLIPEDYYNAHKSEIIGTLREIEASGNVGFTHRLPTTKTQQYYEMIGKYPHQFGSSWDDASFDRVYSGPDQITAHNNYYTDMRDQSNRFYDIAGYGTMVALVNHVISAIDAGFTTRRYNRNRVRLEMSYNNMYYKSEYVNLLGVNVKW